jgi:hypothetical protein
MTDLVCLDDLDLFANETATELEALEQDVYHVLIETPGSNPDDPNRGIGVLSMLSGSVNDLAGLTQTIDAQLQKDDRINAASSRLVQLPEGGYVLEVEIVADAGVLNLSYGYSGEGGLLPQ